MDPYRDNSLVDILNQLREIKSSIDDTHDAVTKIEVKSSPIKKALADKINSFIGFNFMLELIGLIFLSFIIAGVSYTCYKYLTTDEVISHCVFNKEEFGSKITITAIREWHFNKKFGSFEDLEEAKEIAKLNGCPNE